VEIQEMRATFGKLQDDTLALRPGLNCIYAPNESGKSTWSHFLRIMLYGLSTRDRGALADKNRFAPWSGAAMRGQMDVADSDGTRLTLSRDTRRATAPMGHFTCTYTGTADAVPGIDGQSAGETLLGVPREVFERSAFIRQSALAVDSDAELDRRADHHRRGGRVLYGGTGPAEEAAEPPTQQPHHRTDPGAGA